MKSPVIVLVAVVALGIGVAVGTMLDPGTAGGGAAAPDAGEGDRISAAEEIVRYEEERDRLATEKKRLEAEQVKLRAENEVLEKQLAALRALHPPEAAAKAKATDDAGRFFTDRYNGVMKKVDWKTVGSSLGSMKKLIGEIVPALAKGQAPDMQKVMEIQKLNQHLLQAAVTVATELPGTGVNGAFSSPAFMLNAMASTLVAADRPLSKAQEERIETITKDWIAADEKRMQAYDENTWTIVRLYEEAEIKDGFFRDAFSVMTPEQVGVLTTDLSRGRVRLDLFSSSLIYVQRVRPVPFDEKKDLIEFFVNTGLGDLKFTDAEKVTARDVVTGWLDGIPNDLVFRESNALDLEGMLRTERVTAWAKHQVALLERLSEAIPFDESRTRFAQAVGGVAVPLKKPQKVE
jgi:hypothetical protein